MEEETVTSHRLLIQSWPHANPLHYTNMMVQPADQSASLTAARTVDQGAV